MRIEEEIVSNSENLGKLLEDASLLCLYSQQCVKQMVLECLAVWDYSMCLFKSHKARLQMSCNFTWIHFTLQKRHCTFITMPGNFAECQECSRE